jgi:VCBS repeat-containing protein
VLVCFLGVLAPIAGATIRAGDLVVSDLTAAPSNGNPGTLFRVDRGTGGTAVLSSGAFGPLLPGVRGVGVQADRTVVAAVPTLGMVVRVGGDGVQQPVSANGLLVSPVGVAVAGDRSLLVADPGAAAVIRVDPGTGAQTTVSSGISPRLTGAIAVESGGAVLVGVADDLLSRGQVLRVDPATGARTPVASGGPLVEPDGFALEADGDIVVTDPGAGVLRIDASSGAVSTVLSGAPLVTPSGAGVEADGSIVVVDADAFGGAGGVIRITPLGGAPTIVSSGAPFADPTAIAIAPATDTAPIAADDEYRVAASGALDTPAPGVLANDRDAEHDPLTARRTSDPAHGTTALDADGSFTYTPEAGYQGSDAFRYEASDGMLSSAPASVAIRVGQPEAQDDSYSATENQRLDVAAPGVLSNDADAEGDALTLTLVSPPAHGAVTLRSDGSFAYTPDRNYMGQDSWTYKVTDGHTGSRVATVAVNVTWGFAVLQAGDVVVSDVAARPFQSWAGALLWVDPDSGRTSVLIDTSATGDAVAGVRGVAVKANGEVLATVPELHAVIRFDGGPIVRMVASNGLLVTPTGVALGDDGSMFVADPGAGAVIRIDGVTGGQTTVASGLPRLTGAIALARDRTLLVGVSEGAQTGSVLRVDPSSGTTAVIASGAVLAEPDGLAVEANGDILVADPSSGILRIDGSNSAVSTVAGGPPLMTPTGVALAADGSILVVDTDAFGGAGGVIRIARDTGRMTTLSSGAPFEDPSGIAVVPPAQTAPRAADDAYQTSEDTALAVPAPGVLTNDHDAENDPLTVQKTSDPSHGSTMLKTDGSFTYTPDRDYAGTDTFTYTASDGAGVSGTATVTITVDAVNDPPVARDDAYATDEDTALSVAAPGLLTNDTDVDGDRLSAALAGGPAHGVLNLTSDGSLRYTPAPDYSGPDSFSYRATDGSASSSPATVRISVAAVDDPPDVRTAPGGSCSADDRSVTVRLVLSDVDTAATALSLAGTSSNTTLLPNSGIRFAGAGTERTISLAPLAGRTGAATVTVVAADGQKSTRTTVTLRVGGNGNDTLTGTAGTDAILAENGNDTLTGLAAADVLCGGSGNDSLDAGDGDDTLVGALGNDRLTGGPGADRFSGGAGTDTATDFRADQGDTQDGTIP